ncbi:MAG: bifunctional hydroxymethylpyrimidine kinase/phosphomethylpyrimidine kinase [Kiritimatiellaeota bacterium]|nr:bifunctional hydroxymethylpyrimidine kinase/phosphomethylpyrimidine kinase [Kiritimatiellota bacterium]
MSLDENNFGMRQMSALTIAGSDSGGNAGIQADLRAFRTFGVHGCTVITALTAQNPFEVRSVVVPEAAFVGDQLDMVLGTYSIHALKTGMLAMPEVIEVVADRLMCHSRIAKIIDPVMVATSGAKLLQDDAIEVLRKRLLPLATLITPNLPEAEALLGRAVATREEQADAARALAEMFGCAALVKGGHGVGGCAEDALFDGERTVMLSSPRVGDPLTTHGTGCSLSAAITASLACGRTLLEAVTEAKAYVYGAIRSAMHVGEAVAVLGIPEKLPTGEIRVEDFRAEKSARYGDANIGQH